MTNDEHMKCIRWIIGMQTVGHAPILDEDGFMDTKLPGCRLCGRAWPGAWAGYQDGKFVGRCGGRKP